MRIHGFTKACDSISEWTGRGISWLIWIVMGLCVLEVFSRRVLGSPHIWTCDVTNVFYGIHFMFLAGYALLYRAHVSIDIFYVRFSRKGQSVLNVITYLLFFFPFVLVLLYVGTDSAVDSWRFRERTVIGLPLVYPILKTVTPVTALLLFIQGLSELAKNLFYGAYGAKGEAL
jgi:TRAP-type mannitol/chloroaromatic compound transport system permease small subunit